MSQKSAIVTIGAIILILLGIGSYYYATLPVNAPVINPGTQTQTPTTSKPTTPKPPVTTAPQATSTDYNLKVGQSIVVAGVTAKLISISDDSRCPSDVVCIQAGTVRANFSIEESSVKPTTKTYTLGVPVANAYFTGELVSVAPYPKATQTISQSEYTIVFRVRVP